MTHKQLLEQVLEVVQQYLPPDGIDAKEAMYRIVGLVDPMPEEKTLEQHRAEFEEWLLLCQTFFDPDKTAKILQDAAWEAWKAARGVTE